MLGFEKWRNKCDYRVRYDGRVYQCLLAGFGSKVRFAFARVSTYCREVLRVAMHGYGGERKYYVYVL